MKPNKREKATSAEMNDLRGSYRDTLFEKVYPKGPFIDLEGLAQDLSKAVENDNRAMEWDCDLWDPLLPDDHLETPTPEMWALIHGLTGTSGQGIFEFSSTREAEKALQSCELAKAWLLEANPSKVTRFETAIVASMSLESAKGDARMVLTFRTRANAAKWLLQVKRKAHELMPNMGVWRRRCEPHDAGRQVLRSGVKDARKGAIIFLAMLADKWGYCSPLLFGKDRGFPIGYAAARRILARQVEALKELDPGVTDISLKANAAWGGRFAPDDIARTPKRILDRAVEHKDLVRGVSMAFKRKGGRIPFHQVARVIAILGVDLARKMLAMVFMDKVGLYDIVSALPSRPIDSRIVKQLERQENPLAQLKSYTPFWSSNYY